MNNTMKQLQARNAELFNDMIGQEQPKRAIKWHLGNYIQTGIIPNFLYISPRGQGKTTMAKETARGLYEFDENHEPIMVKSNKTGLLVPKRKDLVEVNCSTLTTKSAFINAIVIPHIAEDKKATIFLDEASEIPPDITVMMLSMLNRTPDNKNLVRSDDYVFEVDFKRTSFILATSQPQKVHPDLQDRLERITLQSYTLDELADICAKYLPDVKCDRATLLDVATTLRGNARSGYKMAEKIAAHCHKSKKFGAKEWNELKEILSIAPLGLNDIEIQVLRILADNPNGVPLTMLSAKTTLSREALRQDVELYLQKHGLMHIQTTGRQITPKGLEYLRGLPKNFACK